MFNGFGLSEYGTVRVVLKYAPRGTAVETNDFRIESSQSEVRLPSKESSPYDNSAETLCQRIIIFLYYKGKPTLQTNKQTNKRNNQA